MTVPRSSRAWQEVTAPFRSRVTYVGYRAFGSGDGAVLVDREVVQGPAVRGGVRDRRNGASPAACSTAAAGPTTRAPTWSSTATSRQAPGRTADDRIRGDGDRRLHPVRGRPAAAARRRRQDVLRLLEAGWWRTRAALGDFGPQDFATQAELVGPDGVGLLVYGSGAHWGTAYLGPDGHAPDSAGTLVATEPVGEPPAEGLIPEAGLAPEPELVDIAAGESLLGSRARRRPRRRSAAETVRRRHRRRRRAGQAARGASRPRDVDAARSVARPAPAGRLPGAGEPRRTSGSSFWALIAVVHRRGGHHRRSW